MGKKQRPAGFGRKQVLNLNNQDKSDERYAGMATGPTPHVIPVNNPLQGLMQSYKSDSEEEEDMDAKLQDFMKEIETVEKKEPSKEAKKSKHTKSVAEKPVSDWQECYDESSGYVYYWNMKTNAVTWDKPTDLTVQVVKGKLESKQLRRHKYDRNALLMAQSNTNIPKRKRKSSGSDSSKSPVEEKIEMITSFGPASSDSDSDSDDNRSKIKGRRKRNKTGSSCSDEPSSPKIFGPQLPPELKVMPQPPPGKTIGPRIKKDLPKSLSAEVNQQKPATVPKESPVDSPKAQDEETDVGILNRLKQRIKQLQDLGGDIPDEMRKYLDKSGETDESLTDDIMSAIENEIPPDYKEKNTGGKDSTSEVKLSFKVADRPKATLKTKSKIDIFAEDEASDGSGDGDSEKKKEQSTLLQYPEPNIRHNLMKPRKFLDKTDIDPARKEEKDKKGVANLDVKKAKVSSDSESLFKYKKYQEDPSDPKSHRGFGYEGKASHRKKGAPSFVKGDTLNDTYDPMEPTEDIDMDLGTSSDSSTDGKREKKRRKPTEEIRAETASESDIMSSKLEFLDVDKEPVPPVKVMLLQLQVLQFAWKSGSLATEYFRNWLKKQHSGITQLEESVMPPGWSCLWDRQEKQYYYMNDVTGEKQWVFPTDSAENQRTSDDIQQQEKSPMEHPLPAVDDPPPPGLRSPPRCLPSSMNTDDGTGSVDDRPSISELLCMPPPPPPNKSYRQEEKDSSDSCKSRSASPNSDIDGLPMMEESPLEHATYAAPRCNDSFTSKLDDFYSEISALEEPLEVEAAAAAPPPLPVEAAPQLLVQPPLPPLPPPTVAPLAHEPTARKKLKRPKLSTGLALKKKNVTGLVAKWQKVQSQLTDPKGTTVRY